MTDYYRYGYSDFDCNCPYCRGKRAWDWYQLTGEEPDWRAVRAWRARLRWLATAKVSERRGLSSPRTSPDDPA